MSTPSPSRPPTRIRNTKKKRPNKGILLAMLGLSAGLYVLLSPRPTPQSPPPQETPALALAAKDRETVEVEVEPPAVETPAYQAILRKIESGLNEIGLIVDEKGETSFQLVIKKKGVCFPGDFDAMKRVFGPSDKLLVSLESLDPQSSGSASDVSELVSIDDIEQGRKIRMKIDLKKKGAFGIFVCGDSLKKKSCMGKKEANFNQILNNHFLSEHRDSIYYFQFGMIDESYPTVFTGIPRGIAEVREIVGKGQAAQLEEAARLMRSLRSMPPDTSHVDQIISVTLPIAGLDSSSCGFAPKNR